MKTPSTRQPEWDKLNELIDGIGIAMLTTVDPQGRLKSRPMTTQQIDASGNLWFLGKQSNELALQIQADSTVNLSYADAATNRYVSIAGEAEVLQDSSKVAELWKKEHEVWFPEGKDDPEIVAIRVTIREAEFWDMSVSEPIFAIPGTETDLFQSAVH